MGGKLAPTVPQPALARACGETPRDRTRGGADHTRLGIGLAVMNVLTLFYIKCAAIGFACAVALGCAAAALTKSF